MPGKWPWFERHFTFDFPPEKFPDIIERLRGTPVRVEELVRGLSTDILTRRDGEAWSIQENVGHLPDIEPLWIGRIDDMLGGAEVMREADLTNKKTHEADHNSHALSELFTGFRKVRGQLGIQGPHDSRSVERRDQHRRRHRPESPFDPHTTG